MTVPSFLRHAAAAISLTVAARGYAPLAGVSVTSVRSGAPVDLSEFLTDENDGGGSTLLVLGTYAADFNSVEYAQRLRYYLPDLREKCGVRRFGLVLNCEADAATKLTELVDLDTTSSVELLVDPDGAAGRAFGVGRGWRPDDVETSPYLKLFGMLWGLGAWATLPAVIGGYIGNPFRGQPWIEDALAVGQRQGRWPDTALELSNDEEQSVVVENKFAALPLVGEWPRRPLELATLRLQNMIDISIKNWDALAPTADALEKGVLTQLGGCVVVDPSTGTTLFEWKDPGICAVANFEDILEKVKPSTGATGTAVEAPTIESSSATVAEQ